MRQRRRNSSSEISAKDFWIALLLSVLVLPLLAIEGLVIAYCWMLGQTVRAVTLMRRAWLKHFG